jgi:2-keto-3-deoxy-6-phosphogluconate aldolase
MKTLRAWSAKVLKSLTQNSVEKTDKATQVAQPLIKGGVEVAENTENTEAVEAPVEEVEIVEEAEAVEEGEETT